MGWAIRFPFMKVLPETTFRTSIHSVFAKHLSVCVLGLAGTLHIPRWMKVRHSPAKQTKAKPQDHHPAPFPSQSSFSNYPQSTTALVGKGIQGWVFSASAKAIHNLFSWTFSKWVPFYKIPTLPIPWNTEISLGGGHSQADMGGKSHSAKQEMGKRSDFVFLYHFAKASWWGGRGQ